MLGFREGGGMGPGLEAPMYWNFLAMLCLAVILASVRMRQAEFETEIDSLRRMAHNH